MSSFWWSRTLGAVCIVVSWSSFLLGCLDGQHQDSPAAGGLQHSLYVAHDGALVSYDAATSAVVRTFTVRQAPAALATFGDKEGASHVTGPIE